MQTRLLVMFSVVFQAASLVMSLDLRLNVFPIRVYAVLT